MGSTVVCKVKGVSDHFNHAAAELFLEKDDGSFDRIYFEDETFSHGMNFMFYATLGEVKDNYNDIRSFGNTSNAFLKMEIDFDENPWEFGWQLTTLDGQLIMYRPPRYYYDKISRSDVETFAVPPAKTTYKLTVVDTYGDGLRKSRTMYRIIGPDDEVLVESSFQKSPREEKTFEFGADTGSSVRGWSLGAAALTSMLGLFAMGF